MSGIEKKWAPKLQHKTEVSKVPAKVIDPIDWKKFNLTAASELKCEEKKELEPRILLCTDEAASKVVAPNSNISQILKDVLMADPKLNFMDLGPGIGYYSLLAANLDRKVVAVEPFRENIILLGNSAQKINKLRQIIVFQNALSDSSGDSSLEDPVHAFKTSAVRTITAADLMASIPHWTVALRANMQGNVVQVGQLAAIWEWDQYWAGNQNIVSSGHTK